MYKNHEQKLARERARYQTDPQKKLTQNRAWATANPEKIRKAQRARYAAKKDEMLAYAAAWRDANRDRLREIHRAWRAANPDRVRQSSRKWYYANPKRAQSFTNAWIAANPERAKEIKVAKGQRRRALLCGAAGIFTLADWRSLVARSRLCYWCGRRWTKIYRPTHDHIIPLSKGGSNSPENSVCACKECNSRKQDSHFNPSTGQGILL